jgi:hypothetical protein
MNNLRTVDDSFDGRKSVKLQFLTMQIDCPWANETCGNFLAWCDIGDSCSKMATSSTRQFASLTGIAWKHDVLYLFLQTWMIKMKCNGVTKSHCTNVIEREMTEMNDVVQHRIWDACFEGQIRAGTQQTMFAPFLLSNLPNDCGWLARPSSSVAAS